MKIDKEEIERTLIGIHGWTKESILNYIYYRSPCKRYTLQEDDCSNLSAPGEGWSVHIDNSDMQTIGRVSVNTISQIFGLMHVYKDC